MSAASSFNLSSARSQLLRDKIEPKMKELETTDPQSAEILRSLDFSAMISVMASMYSTHDLNPAAIANMKTLLVTAEQKYLESNGGVAESLSSQPVLTTNVTRELRPLIEGSIPALLKEALQPQNSLVIKGHFYQIKDEKGNILGHLLGTTHVIDRCLFPLTPAINKVIESSKRVFFEIKEMGQLSKDTEILLDLAISKMTPEKLAKTTQNYLKQLQDFTIRDLSWKDLQQKVSEMTPTEALKLCVRQFSFLLALKQGNFSDDGHKIQGLDDLVFYKCERLGKPIFGLESAEEHYKLIGEINFDEEPKLDAFLEFAKAQATEWAEGRDYGNQLILTNPTEEEYKIGEKRSEEFSRKIFEDLSANGKGGLYVFGLAHLYDNKSIIKDLTARGLKVERV